MENVNEKSKYERIVNQWNLITEDEIPKPSELTVFKARCTNEEMLLDKVVYDAYMTLKNEASENGYYLDTVSCYRTIQQQIETMEYYVNLIGEEAAQKRVAQPGSSEHHTGYAIDICFYRNDQFIKSDDIQEDDEDYKWVLENMAKYGFILRYPKNSMEKTGVIYEPWHIRYVGRELAYYLKENDMLLEDYHKLKKQK